MCPLNLSFDKLIESEAFRLWEVFSNPPLFSSWFCFLSDYPLIYSVTYSLWLGLIPKAASFFCLDGLGQATEQFIYRHLLQPNNVSSFWNCLNDECNEASKTLELLCARYFAEHLDLVSISPDFVKLDKDLLVRLFHDPSSPLQVATASSKVRYLPPVQYIAKSSPLAMTNPFVCLQTFALAKWFAANEPKRLKRKLMASPCADLLPAAKRICLAPSHSEDDVSTIAFVASPSWNSHNSTLGFTLLDAELASLLWYAQLPARMAITHLYSLQMCTLGLLVTASTLAFFECYPPVQVSPFLWLLCYTVVSCCSDKTSVV